MFTIYQKGLLGYNTSFNIECVSYAGMCCMKGVCCRSVPTPKPPNQ